MQQHSLNSADPGTGNSVVETELAGCGDVEELVGVSTTIHTL